MNYGIEESEKDGDKSGQTGGHGNNQMNKTFFLKMQELELKKIQFPCPVGVGRVVFDQRFNFCPVVVNVFQHIFGINPLPLLPE